MKLMLFTLSLLIGASAYGATSACNTCRQAVFIQCYNASNLPHAQRVTYCNNQSYSVCRARGKC